SSSDFVVMSTGAIPTELVADIDATDGVSASAPMRTSATSDLSTGEPYFVSTGDLDALADTAGITVSEGDASTVTDGEGIAVPDLAAAFGGAGSSGAATGPMGEQLGDVIPMRAFDGSEAALTVEVMLEAKL